MPIPPEKRPPDTPRDELLGLPAYAAEYRRDQAVVAPQVVDLSLGGQLFEKLKFTRHSAWTDEAIRQLSLEDLQAIVLANAFSFRQQADEPDDYARWSNPSPLAEV